MQFCVECGTPNAMTGRYCVKCKTLLVLTKVEKEFFATKWWRTATRPKRIIAAAIPILVLAGVIAVVVPKPSSVALSLAVDAPFGGIFNDDCTPTDGARKIGATEAEVVAYGAAPGTGSKTPLVFKDQDGECVAIANLSVYPGTNHEIYVAGTLAGELNEGEVRAGQASENVALQVTHDLSGTITLSDNYYNCKKSNLGPDCTIPSSANVQAKFQKASLLCYGMGSFSDFKQVGTPITFTGLGTNASVKVQLEKGSPSVSDYKTGKVLCEYKFTLTGLVHDDKGYRVKVGRHNANPTSIEDLESNSWIYEYEFKG